MTNLSKHHSLVAFVAFVAAVLLGFASFATVVAQRGEFDIVLANGRVIDPESKLDAIRFVGITGNRIAAISSSPLKGKRTIDAKGMVIAPGFIDLHEHGQVHENYKAQAMDGVTSSFELEVGTADVARWYAERAGKAVVNFGVSIGHIPVRMAVMGDKGEWLPTGPASSRAATDAEIAQMKARITEGLQQGAVAVTRKGVQERVAVFQYQAFGLFE